MNKYGKIIVLLVLLLMVSVTFNVIDYISKPHDEEYYDGLFHTEYEALIYSLNQMVDNNKTTHDVLIKETVSIIAKLDAIRPYTSYKDSPEISKMIHYLNRLFVLSPNEYIFENASRLNELFSDSLSKLSDERNWVNINSILWDLASGQPWFYE